jgi:hypothetical protein
VGTFTDGAGVQHGFLLSEGAFTVIDYPGASGIRTLAINNLGRSTGTTLGESGFPVDNIAFIADPIPEPSTVFLTLIAWPVLLSRYCDGGDSLLLDKQPHRTEMRRLPSRQP